MHFFKFLITVCYPVKAKCGDSGWFWSENCVNELLPDNMFDSPAESDGGDPFDGIISNPLGGNTNPNPNPNPLPPIEVTPEFLNNEKLECIWGKINNMASNHSNSLITSIFANFSGLSYNPQDIRITVKDTLINKNKKAIYGQCLPVNNEYVITLNGSQIQNRAPIEIFKTMLHEMLHAHLKRMYGSSPDTFISLFSKHIKNTKGVKLSEHDIMKNYYIPQMVNALRAFDQQNGFKDDDYVYEGIAINGLDDSPSTDTQQHVVFSENYFRSRNLECEK